MSLLAPFGFGQKHAYFHVQLTIHEVSNVPLVTGLFACKWKTKGSHSLASLQHSAAAAAHQQASRVVSTAARKGKDVVSSKEAAKDIQATDHDSGASNSLAIGPPHEYAQRQPSDPTSTDAASFISASSRSTSHHNLHKPAFISNLLRHKDKDHDKTKDGDSKSQSSVPVLSPDPTGLNSDRESLAPEEETDATSSSSPTSRRDSTTSRKTSASRPKSIKDVARQKATETHDNNVDPFLFFTQEPKGETDFIKVHEHRVEWERVIQVGMRVGIGKPKTSGHNDTSHSNSRNDSPALSSKSSAKDLRARSHREQHLEDITTAWGRLMNSELKLTIKQEMPANTKSTTHPSVLGHVLIDLSEFAPEPPSSSSGSRPHHHHHNHHHHHRHHHHGPEGEHSYRERTQRTETRKFLLNDSKTNATVKLTIQMTFLGGAREYFVPPITNGLMVNGLGSIMASNLLEAASRDSASGTAGNGSGSLDSGGTSDESSLRNEPVRATAHIRNRELIGQGLPSASSLSLGHMSFYSQHNMYGPPLKSIYTKQKWNNKVPTENLVAGTPGSEGAKKKPLRTSDTSFFSSRNPADQKPDDLMEALFKGIAVGGRQNGQVQDDTVASKPAAAPAQNSEHLVTAVDSQSLQLERKASHSPERTRERPRTVSTTSNISKKSDRSFSFAFHKSKDKDKDKFADKDKELHKQRLAQGKEKAKGKKSSFMARSKSASSLDVVSLPGDKARSTHLSVPASDGGRLTPGLLVESPSASTDAHSRPSNETTSTGASPTATRASTKRLSSVRWNLGDEVSLAVPTPPTPSQEITPVGETMDKEALDRAAMPPPPSVVVDNAYIPIRAGGITAASSSALNLTGSQTSPPDATAAAAIGDDSAPEDGSNPLLTPRAKPLSLQPPVSASTGSKRDADAASIRTFSSATSAPGDEKRKISSNDLKGLYQAGLSIPQTLSTNTSVGLDCLKKTSRAIGQFAKDAKEAAKASRPFSRPNSSADVAMSFRDSQGVSGRERRSKGNRGIEPSEAASKGWSGAGWLRPISTTPALLPPSSPDLSSSEQDDFEEADGLDSSGVDRFGSLASRNSDGRRSSATDQTAFSDLLNTPNTAATKSFRSDRPQHNRDDSFASVYHDVQDDDNVWLEKAVRFDAKAVNTTTIPMQGQVFRFH